MENTVSDYAFEPIDLVEAFRAGLVSRQEARNLIGLSNDGASSADLLPLPSETIDPEDDAATPTWEDFVAALRRAGYENIQAAAAKWHLLPFDELDRTKKLSIYQRLSTYKAPARTAPNGPQRAVSPHHDVTADTSRCPICGSPGARRTMRNGDSFYKCSDVECQRRGQTTTWDENNWARRRAEAEAAR